jgi:eukaryotic-like serine/threonine-protein kinase
VTEERAAKSAEPVEPVKTEVEGARTAKTGPKSGEPEPSVSSTTVSASAGASAQNVATSAQNAGVSAQNARASARASAPGAAASADTPAPAVLSPSVSSVVISSSADSERPVPLVRPTAQDALVGRVIAGKYRIEALIGAGAMGSVYRAKQVSLDKHVALKILHNHLRNDGGFVTRFHREAKAASRLDHPNAVRVSDFGEDTGTDPVCAGRLYIAMELLEGRDLFQLIQEDFPLSRERTIEIMRQTLAAVASAHDVGIIHRDLKPENIMISHRINDDGVATDFIKVCDFGIAKLTEQDGESSEESRKVSVMGLLVGTPEYMSPEQARGESLDFRSDLYAMGVVLYQMLVGRVPFEGSQPFDVALRHISDEPEPPTAREPRADATLERVCLTAMSKDKSMRYQTAREMRAVLRAALEGRPLTAIADATGMYPSLPPMSAMYTPAPIEALPPPAADTIVDAANAGDAADSDRPILSSAVAAMKSNAADAINAAKERANPVSGTTERKSPAMETGPYDVPRKSYAPAVFLGFAVLAGAGGFAYYQSQNEPPPAPIRIEPMSAPRSSVSPSVSPALLPSEVPSVLPSGASPLRTPAPLDTAQPDPGMPTSGASASTTAPPRPTYPRHPQTWPPAHVRPHTTAIERVFPGASASPTASAKPTASASTAPPPPLPSAALPLQPGGPTPSPSPD